MSSMLNRAALRFGASWHGACRHGALLLGRARGASAAQEGQGGATPGVYATRRTHTTAPEPSTQGSMQRSRAAKLNSPELIARRPRPLCDLVLSPGITAPPCGAQKISLVSAAGVPAGNPQAEFKMLPIFAVVMLMAAGKMQAITVLGIDASLAQCQRDAKAIVEKVYAPPADPIPDNADIVVVCTDPNTGAATKATVHPGRSAVVWRPENR